MYRKQAQIPFISAQLPGKLRYSLRFAGSLFAGIALAEAVLAADSETTVLSPSSQVLPTQMSQQLHGTIGSATAATVVTTPASDASSLPTAIQSGTSHAGTLHPGTGNSEPQHQFTLQSYQNLSAERARELMDLDNRAIDDAAARLKQVTRNRLEADYLNIQYLATIDELHRRIAELESLLHRGRVQQESLDSNRTSLEQALSNITQERDDALSQLQLLNSEMQEQIGSVLTLKSETETAADQLAAKENQIADLNNQIDQLTSRHEVVISNSTALEEELTQSHGAIEDLRNQLAAVIAERDNNEEARTQLNAQVVETENSLQQTRDLLAENEQLLDAHIQQVQLNEQTIQELQGQLEVMSRERDSAIQQVTQGTDEQTQLQSRLSALTQEHDAAIAHANDLQQMLTEAEAQRDQYLSELSQERDLALASTEEVKQQLMQTQSLHDQQLDTLSAERDDALSTAEELQSRLTETEARYNGQLSELSLQRDNAREMTEQIQNALTESMELRDEQITEITRELNDTADRAEQLQFKLTKAEARIEEITAERESISDELTLANSRISDTDNALLSNQQLHEQTRIELLGLTTETQSLRDQIRKLEITNETLSDDSQQLAQTRDALEAQLADTRAALEAGNLELQGTLETVADLNTQVTALTSERDHLIAQVNELNTHVASLETANENAKTDYLEQLSNSEQQLLEEKKTFEQALLARDQDISDFTNQITALVSDLDKAEKEASNTIADKDNTIASLQEQVDATSAQQQQTLEEISQLNAKLDKAHTENRKLHAQVKQAEQNAVAFQSRVSDSEKTIQTLTAAQQATEAEAARIAYQAEQLRLSLSEELSGAKLGNITVENARDDNSIPIRLGNADFFETGSAELTRDGERKLTRLAEIIDQYHDRHIVVEGHTDTVPIGVGLKNRFASNWDLSVARAATAVRHIQRATGIDPRSLSAAGYGEYRPIADNNTESGRQQNRRIEVVLYQSGTGFEAISVLDE
jgi:chemotaxis protein MotB